MNPPTEDSILAPLTSGDGVPGVGKSLLRRVVGGTSWTLAGAISGRVATLLAVILATRILAPDEYGQLSAIQLLLTSIGGVAGLGLGLATTKRVAEYRLSAPAIVPAVTSSATVLVALSGGVATLGVVLARDALASRWLHTPTLATPLAWGSGVIVASAVFGVQMGILTGLEEFRAAAAGNAIRSLLSAGALVAGVMAGGVTGGAIGLTIGECLGAVAALGLAYRAQGSTGNPIFTRSLSLKDSWQRLRGIGLPAVAASTAILLSLVAGQAILTAQPDGFALFARFSVAYRWSLVVLFVPAALAPVTLPLLSSLAGSRQYSRFRRLLRSNLAGVTAITAIPAVVMILARDLVLGLSGDAYQADTRAFVVLMVSTVFVAWNTQLSQAAIALDSVRAWLVSDLALAVVLVTSAALLIPTLHDVGLATAYLLGYVATCLVLVIPLARRMREVAR